jgi:eukaryotic-like serine/threonine-protein kinase
MQVIDLAQKTTTPVAGQTEPVWSNDGRFIYASTGNRPLGGLLVVRADGSRSPDTLLTLKAGDAWPTSMSPDGAWLAFYGAFADSADRATDVDEDVRFISPITKEIKRLRLPGSQRGARFSPNGRWIAYQSLESGREQVHVRPWPSLDAVYTVSTDGGFEPAWSRDGNELFYRRRNEVLAVSFVETTGEMKWGPPRVLFSGLIFLDDSGDQSYDVASDGRFLMLRPVVGTPLDIQVALNWLSEVRARLDGPR